MAFRGATFQTTSIALDSGVAASVAKPSAALPAVDPNRDFSGTNNQVNGVD